jgi:hypothetical protein
MAAPRRDESRPGWPDGFRFSDKLGNSDTHAPLTSALRVGLLHCNIKKKRQNCGFPPIAAQF